MGEHLPHRVSEIGAGALFDIDVFRAKQMFTRRSHRQRACRRTPIRSRFNFNTGTSASRARMQRRDTAEAWDHVVWSISLSRQLPYNIRPYVTWSKTHIMLDGNNNSLRNTVIRAGVVGSAELREAGLKARLFNGSLL